MTGLRLVFIMMVLGAGVASAQLTGAPPTKSVPESALTSSGQCGVCHPVERVVHEKSRHAGEKVRCTACHGGNDKSLTLSIAHGAGFKGTPSRRQIPALCASCHSNSEMMRPFNLPVDQYALYQTSGHGKLLARGDTRAAVCSDCHGAHEVLPATDPASSVFPVNIARTCGSCHGDSSLVEQGLMKRNEYDEYMTSVHAEELFDHGNRGAPTCISCHGVHGAAPPEIGDMEKVCGQCHTAERRFFDAGPHRAGFAAAGRSECTACHGDHAIQRSQPERLATICAECHGEDSSQSALGQKMWTEYRAAASEVDRAAAIIEEADTVPIATDDYRSRLEQARTYLREALPMAHSVDEETVAEFTLRARSVGMEIESEIHEKLGELRIRKFGLIVFWFYVLLTILVLRRYQRNPARG